MIFILNITDNAIKHLGVGIALLSLGTLFVKR